MYSSEFAGLQFTMPEGWLAGTDEEIANLMGIGAEYLSDAQKWATESAKLSTIYDMMAQDPVTGNNVMVMFENLSMAIGGSKLDEAGYFDVVKKQLENVEDLEYTFNDPFDATAGSIEFYTVQANETSVGLDQYYMMHKMDNYMVVMIITIVDDTKLEDILANFK